MSRLGVEDDIRTIWRTRPHRDSEQRKVAGVAAAIGRRYDVDPVLVRVALIVLTVLGGVGLQLYLLAWMLLPCKEGESSGAAALFGRGRSSMSAGMTIALGIAIAIVGAVGFGNRSFWLFGAVLAVAAIWLLHHYRSDAGEAGVPAPPRPPLYSTDPPPPGGFVAVAEPDGSPPDRNGPPVTPVTLGLALVAAGVCVALQDQLDVVAGLGIVLAVLCAGLLVGAFLRTGRGLIVVALPLALATVLIQAAPVDDADQILGEARWGATSPADLEREYTLMVGSLELDLRRLALPTGTTERTTVASDLGEIKVFLPPGLDVEVSCRVQLGESKCLGRSGSGVPGEVEDVLDDGTDGPGGGRLVLDVEGGVGSVEVTRG